MNKIKVIAEIGNNHNGSFAKAKKAIYEAKEAGADYVKFQHINPEKFVHSKLKSLVKGNDKYQIQRLKKICLNLNQIKDLYKLSRKLKIGFGVSVFDIESVKELKKCTDFYKVASSDINFYPMLNELKKSKKKVIISTGMSNMEEILYLKKIFKEKKIILMHCVSSYPTPDKYLNLLSVKYLKDKTNWEIGYSDHSAGSLSCELSSVLGATYIEKHFLISKSDKNVGDFSVSISATEFKKMIKRINIIQSMLGKYEKNCLEIEKKLKGTVRRSIYTTVNIKKNEKIDTSNSICLRPFNKKGLSILKFNNFKKLYAKKNIPKNALIKHSDVKKI